jgi:plasmid rolling circle replication initiator protein Rep
VFKENVSELVQIINLQTSLKRGVKDTDFWNSVLSAQCPILKWISLKVNVYFGST